MTHAGTQSTATLSKRVVVLERHRLAEIQKMEQGQRRYTEQILAAAEKTLQAKHTEEDGVHYEPSGGLKSKGGRLNVPWPLPKMNIGFQDRLLQGNSSSSESDESSDEDEPPASGGAAAAAPAQAARRGTRSGR